MDIREQRFGKPTQSYGTVKEGQFASKFKDRAEACGFFFAGRCRGASSSLISDAVGINRRTATKLLNKSLQDYAGIKIEFKERGEEEFGRLYYTTEIAERLARAAAAAQGEA